MQLSHMKVTRRFRPEGDGVTYRNVVFIIYYLDKDILKFHLTCGFCEKFAIRATLETRCLGGESADDRSISKALSKYSY